MESLKTNILEEYLKMGRNAQDISKIVNINLNFIFNINIWHRKKGKKRSKIW